MDKDDEKPREEEVWYQQHKGKKGVIDPKPCIRHIGDTISKSALMRRQLCADGHTMYIFSEELGSMKSVWKTFGDYFRKAFDQSEVGQDYITATSGVTHAQLNFTGCCTQNIFQKFFTEDNIEDGSSSRMMLAMQMEMFGLRLDKQQQDNEAIPVYKSRNTLLFAQLPEQFTLFDASRERGDGASRETIRKMISRWTKRGLCKKLKSGDTEIWQKLTISA